MKKPASAGFFHAQNKSIEVPASPTPSKILCGRGFSLDWPDLKTAIFHPCNLRQSTQRGIEGSKKQVLTGKSFAKGAYLHSLG
jgi:hypothetical protein